jgi:hypothetical protein
MKPMISKKQRPIEVKKEKLSELRIFLKNMTDEFDSNEFKDVYFQKRKELTKDVLNLIESEKYSIKKIAQVLAALVVSHEKLTFNMARLMETARHASGKQLEIEEIESTTPKGGRKPIKERYAKEVWLKYVETHKGKTPSKNTLFKLVNQELEKERVSLNQKFSESARLLTKEQISFRKHLNGLEKKKYDEVHLYSNRSAENHWNIFIKLENN